MNIWKKFRKNSSKKLSENVNKELNSNIESNDTVISGNNWFTRMVSKFKSGEQRAEEISNKKMSLKCFQFFKSKPNHKQNDNVLDSKTQKGDKYTKYRFDKDNHQSQSPFGDTVSQPSNHLIPFISKRIRVFRKTLKTSQTNEKCVYFNDNKGVKLLKHKKLETNGETISEELIDCNRDSDAIETKSNALKSCSTLLRFQSFALRSEPNIWSDPSILDPTLPQDMRDKLIPSLDDLNSKSICLGKYRAKGSFGYVVTGVDLGIEVAIKIFKDFKQSKSDYNKLDERTVQLFRHKNVVHFVSIYTKDDIRIMIMPLALTDLFYYLAKLYIIDNKLLSECDVRLHLKDIISGLQYLHSYGWAHLDLKPRNILVFRDGLKICDFDGSKKIFHSNGDLIKEIQKNGTISFHPLESLLFQQSIDLRLFDVWSLGVVLFIMLTTNYPTLRTRYKTNERNKCIERMKGQKYFYPKNCNISEESKDLIRHMLEPNQELRYNCSQIVSHQWFSMQLSHEDRPLPTHDIHSIIEWK